MVVPQERSPLFVVNSFPELFLPRVVSTCGLPMGVSEVVPPHCGNDGDGGGGWYCVGDRGVGGGYP
jgi:hypothetical protein